MSFVRLLPAGLLAGVTLTIDLALLHGGWGSAWWPDGVLRGGAVILITLAAGAWIARMLSRRDAPAGLVPPTPVEAYAASGLGPLPDDAAAADLYVDLVKRTVANVIYEDRPYWHFDENNHLAPSPDFCLEHRLNGLDLPREAHTMVGLRRLDNLQRCVDHVLRAGVPGDLVETGVYRGGAAIFMRAILKGRGVTDRRVIACDTFQPPPVQGNGLAARAGLAIVQMLAFIPGKRWRRAMFMAGQNAPSDRRSFPRMTDPSEELIDWGFYVLRNLHVLDDRRDRTSLAAVRSHFARYGLLDERVLFLLGFFSDTLPTAPIEKVAVLRLDGDTYESTRDVLEQLYPKLSPGGCCIIDDYHAFPDCRRAVDEYRTQHGIAEELIPIDRHAVYWLRGVPGADGTGTPPTPTTGPSPVDAAPRDAVS